MSAGTPSRGRRRTAILVGAVVAVIAVVLAVVLAMTLGGGSSDRPASPQSVAQAWGDAALFHDAGKLRALSCPSAAGGFGIYGMVFEGTGVKAGAVVSEGADAWSVPITTVGPGGGTTLHLRVERHNGKYLVC